MRSFFSGLVVGATTVFLLCSFHHNTVLMKQFRLSSISLSSSPAFSSQSQQQELSNNDNTISAPDDKTATTITETTSSTVELPQQQQEEQQHHHHQQQQQQHLRSTKSDATESSDTTDSVTTSSITDNDKRQQQQPSSKNFYDEDYDVCVVGAGLSGAVIAERYASQQLNSKILIVEKRDHIGGNCYDYIDDDTGVRVSKYGAHLFHTVHDRVWQYVQQFSHWTTYEHEVVGIVDGKHVPIPVNINTVNMLFNLTINSTSEMDEWLKQEQVHYDHEPTNSEEMALSRVGPRLFRSIFEPYTIKQWAKHPKELGPEVTARIPVRNNFDGRYFGDPYQALPTHGYTKFLANIMESPRITVKTETDYFEYKDRLRCKHTYYTGPVDTYFADLGWPKLEYRSLDFERQVIKDVPNSGYFQPAFVVNHPSTEDDYTRIVEYKHLLNQTSPHTVIFIERSKDSGEPYYPVPNDENKELYRKYQDMALKEPNVTFVGRLANYKYFNMDQAILNALELFEKVNTAGSSGTTTDTAGANEDDDYKERKGETDNNA
eukprot:CAMPEP_0113467198 /NCGR_PEP_ID=MMETSP0014_2-20120614/14687_1 /TAXON_ID=2857 /ORGANISM="Nitzschia sp." /LENGTH=545 /DNA_ID=CAMNT_0000359491 /DNA_START=347 /DNA_END=1985 /DNA_ORIENTATION=+ /assembly_acc=CAM_ASM_000159